MIIRFVGSKHIFCVLFSWQMLNIGHEPDNFHKGLEAHEALHSIGSSGGAIFRPLLVLADSQSSNSWLYFINHSSLLVIYEWQRVPF